MAKIVFYGTPHFAAVCLKSLIDSGNDVCAVVTVPDKPVGRGKKIQYSSVKEYCLKQKIALLQPESLKAPSFVNTIAALEPDLQIVVAFRMLPKQVWSLPRLGTFNLHASLLPNYRGAAPINWALINGETKTGLTTFLIDEEIDTGKVLLKEEISIDKGDTAGSLYDKMLQKAPVLIAQTIMGLLESTIQAFNQKLTGNEKPAPKLTQENTKIDWKKPLEQICNHIRGLDPHPGAWTFFKNGESDLQKMKIYEALPIYESHQKKLGLLIVNNKELLVTTADGYLNCLLIQLPNKKKMPAKALLNGFTFDEKACVS